MNRRRQLRRRVDKADDRIPEERKAVLIWESEDSEEDQTEPVGPALEKPHEAPED